MNYLVLLMWEYMLLVHLIIAQFMEWFYFPVSLIKIMSGLYQGRRFLNLILNQLVTGACRCNLHTTMALYLKISYFALLNRERLRYMFQSSTKSRTCLGTCIVQTELLGGEVNGSSC